MVQKRPKKANRSLADRVRIVRKINEARVAHPRMKLHEVINTLGYHDVSHKNYYSWRGLQTKEAADEKFNGEQVEHFPLAIIPERHPSKSKPAAPRRVQPREDDDKAIAASLLEVAARLLRR